jgi:hypothetical protein
MFCDRKPELVIYRERMQQDYWRPGTRYIVENIGVIADDLLHLPIILGWVSGKDKAPWRHRAPPVQLCRLHPLFGAYGNGSQSRSDVSSVRIEHQFVTELEKADDHYATGCHS